MSQADPDCRYLLGDLSAALDGEVASGLCAEIERHMRDCEDCRVVVDTLRKTVTLYRQLPPVTMPADARVRLYRALKLEDFIA